MTLDYTNKGKVKIFMYKYINKMLSKLPIDMNGSARTPAAGHFFSARCTRHDIQTALAFTCTRVQAPDKDNY